MDLGDLDPAAVNAALESIKESYLSADVMSRLGAGFGSDIAAKVKEVYDAAMNCPVDWNRPGMNMDGALDILAEFMTREMPFLSQPSRTNLNYLYIMAWK